jgi:hypothetical protein
MKSFTVETKVEFRDDDLDTGLDVKQNRHHLQRMEAGGVSKTFGTPSSCSSRALHFLVNGPSPETWLLRMASAMYSAREYHRNRKLRGALIPLI